MPPGLNGVPEGHQKGTRGAPEGHQRGRRGAPEGHQRGTRGVPEGYQRGTRGIPEGYQRGTRGVPGRVVSLSPDDFGLFSIFKYFKLNVPRVEYKIQNYRESIVRFLKGSFIVNVCDALCLR